MATISVKLRASSIAGKAGTVYYQVTHKRVIRQITTDIHILPEDWDGKQQCLKQQTSGQQTDGRPTSGQPASSAALHSRIQGDITRLRRIVRELDASGEPYTAEEIVRRFRKPEHTVMMLAFMQEQIDLLRQCNRLGTAQNYGYAMRRFARFLGGDIPIAAVTGQLIERFNADLSQHGMVRNTVSFYMRILRSVYNKAVRNGLVEQTAPFKNVYTGIDRTRKRAVGESVIARFIGLDLSRSAPLALARDLFLFSFYTRGMSFVDMAYLRREHIRDGRIRYVRRKTGQEIVIRVEPEMQRIIERYACGEHPYVFPILKSENPEKAYAEYRIALSYYNRLLKRLCTLAGVPQRLSFYTARHSWATAARNHQVPVSVISAGMGHTSERTTQIYLTMLENSLIDNANRGILESLRCVVSL